MTILNLDEIDEPVRLDKFQGNLFDGLSYHETKTLVEINNGKISDLFQSTGILADTRQFPDSMLLLPGVIDIHVHGRDKYDIRPYGEGDQTYKEDSYTLSLALAQGGATRAVCQPNLSGLPIQTEAVHGNQMHFINSEQPHRRKPITPLEMYALISPNSKPQIQNALYKLLWNTFGPTNFPSDDLVIPTLRNYVGRQVTAHCETISGIIKDPALPWHLQRPKQAAIDAVKMLCQFSLDYHTPVNIAHISSGEEMDLVGDFQRRGAPLTYELTPQVLTFCYETFEGQTGYPIKFMQQNPPIRTLEDRTAQRERMRYANYLATDHAPHTTLLDDEEVPRIMRTDALPEKENGMSGMPQASTAGQAYLERVTKGDISLADYVEKSSHNPGELLERELGVKAGRIEKGYDASFTLVSLGKPSRIRNNDVLSKCGWTPYRNMTFSNTIEGVIINGILYTQKAFQRLR